MSPPALLSTRLARVLLGGIVAVGLIESVVSAFVYRPTIGASDWAAAATSVESLPAKEPIWLGTPWLAPLARHHLPRLSRWPAVAPPDLRGASRFHVLGRTGDEWSATLTADLEDLPPPTLVDTQDLGGLQLSTYEQPAAGSVLADFVAEFGRVKVESPTGQCRGRGRRTCDDGRVGVATVEVDYRPRRCIKLDLHDGATVRLAYPKMPTGTTVRGHVAVDDFNARLRSDAPLRMRLSVDDERVAQWLVSDNQGWWPFAVATAAGTHDVQLEVTAPAGGTWQRSGYEPGRPHSFCIELRSLEEG